MLIKISKKKEKNNYNLWIYNGDLNNIIKKFVEI